MTDQKISRWYLAAVVLAALIYVCFELTPSSYGFFLSALGAQDAGPVAGVSRAIRADEWSDATPLFQAAVRNRFRRVNETSFYREDLRNFLALPLKDWSLVFKPQLWGFFVLPPALAFSIYYAFFMCLFLAGYYLLFRELGTPAWLAAGTAVLVYFSGFTQFWWTTLCPLLSGFPWILLIIFRPMAWWKKGLLCSWAIPALALAHLYPAMLITLAWGGLILILAFRPALLRSPGDIAAIAAGGVAAAIVVLAYYGDVISIMRNTVYPGHRVSGAGGTPILAALSEVLPYVSFRLGDYQHLTGQNICEIGALGSFLPLLTLCLTRYRSLKNHPAVCSSLLILLTGYVAITLWEIAPLPKWIGHILVWDRGDSQRWLFVSGFLLTVAALLIWNNKLISVNAARIGMFLILGPVTSIVLKFAWLIHKGEPAFSASRYDILLCALSIAACIAARSGPTESRASALICMVAFMNVYAFARFNPVQPAGPIFDVPETDIVHGLRERAAISPGGVLFDAHSVGATLNGLGFRSVAHLLMAPQVTLFRSYFPAMDQERFNQIFNRFSHIRLTQNALPDSPTPVVIEVPMEVFVPVRNVRRVVHDPPRAGVCMVAAEGAIEQVSLQDAAVTIVGWAPWKAERGDQGIQVLAARPLRIGSLSTVTRPDIAERLGDYGFVKSGFHLQISSADGKAIQPKELVLFAFGTAGGEVRLSCCGCP